MTPAVAYYRCSSSANTGGDTWQRQADRVLGWAARNDHQVVHEFRDEGVPGSVPALDRPGLGACMDHILGNGVKVILIEHADRLARDVIIQEIFLRELDPEIKIICTSTGENLADNSEPTRVMIRVILGAIAECEKLRLVAKLRHARDKKAVKLGRRPEGRKGYRDRLDEILPAIRTLRRQGETWRGIAEFFNHIGTPTEKGQPWKPGTLHRLWKKHGAPK
jgi:DNA invertase Pin-like site-specific DNA recombinase